MGWPLVLPVHPAGEGQAQDGELPRGACFFVKAPAVADGEGLMVPVSDVWIVLCPDSGYLFSGSRPPSRISRSQEVPLPDYFSLLSGSHLSPPLPSPAPSVASSVASSYSSLRHRRPLISPARLNLKGQKLLLFPTTPGELPSTPSSSEEHTPHSSSLFTLEPPLRQPVRDRDAKHSPDTRARPESSSARSSRSIKKEDDSSQSSACVVDTTTQGCSEETVPWKGHLGPSLIRGLLAVSLTANAVFTSAYLYQSLR